MILYCQQAIIDGAIKQFQAIEVLAGKVVSVSAFQPDAGINVISGTMVPGFIDIQVNGGGGVLFNHEQTVEALEKISSAHLRYGTTTLLPTLITDSVVAMERAAEAIIACRKRENSSIAGIHFEGPWLCTAKKGVHKEKYIRSPVAGEIEMLCDPRLGKVMVTLAPENVDLKVIEMLSQSGVIVFLGHSNADSSQVSEALSAGAAGFTHLYNAMSPMTSRNPGMTGQALASDSYAGIIVDGYHADPVSCNVAFRAKGPEQICLVTDAMCFAGYDKDEIDFFDTRILRAGDKLTTPDGTLAGSCLTMDLAVRNTINLCHQSPEHAIQMASRTPAQVLGLDRTLGNIATGYDANMVCLDSNFHVTGVWQSGIKI